MPAMSERLRDAINEQIGRELYSAYLYLAMSAWCADRNLSGFARWLRFQAQEEVSHAMRFFDYLVERGVRVRLEAVDRPAGEYSSALEIMEKSLEHERFISTCIDELYRMAREEDDHASEIHLQWFVEEQVEEEGSIEEIVERMRMFGHDGPALMILDGRLGERTSVA